MSKIGNVCSQTTHHLSSHWGPLPLISTLAVRAGDLDGHGAEQTLTVTGTVSRVKPSLHFRNVSRNVFLSKLNEIDIKTQVHDDMNQVLSNLAEVLYRCVSCSRGRDTNVATVVDARSRWERMLENNDNPKLWQAINWRNELRECDNNNDSKPSDDTFKSYFEEIFNPTNTNHLEVSKLSTQVTIPVLDEPISPVEVETKMKCLKSNKASGLDVLPPTLLKWMPARWIVFIAIYLIYCL